MKSYIKLLSTALLVAGATQVNASELHTHEIRTAVAAGHTGFKTIRDANIAGYEVEGQQELNALNARFAAAFKPGSALQSRAKALREEDRFNEMAAKVAATQAAINSSTVNPTTHSSPVAGTFDAYVDSADIRNALSVLEGMDSAKAIPALPAYRYNAGSAILDAATISAYKPIFVKLGAIDGVKDLSYMNKVVFIQEVSKVLESGDVLAADVLGSLDGVTTESSIAGLKTADMGTKGDNALSALVAHIITGYNTAIKGLKYNDGTSDIAVPTGVLYADETLPSAIATKLAEPAVFVQLLEAFSN